MGLLSFGGGNFMGLFVVDRAYAPSAQVQHPTVHHVVLEPPGIL